MCVVEVNTFKDLPDPVLNLFGDISVKYSFDFETIQFSFLSAYEKIYFILNNIILLNINVKIRKIKR